MNWDTRNVRNNQINDEIDGFRISGITTEEEGVDMDNSGR